MTSPDLPRRFEPTQEERIRTIDRVARAARGSTRFARGVPVRPTPSREQQDEGGGESTLSRTAPLCSIDTATMPASPFFLNGTSDWTGEEEATVGTAITASGGQIIFNEDGIYCVTIWLRANGLSAADPDCSVRLRAEDNLFATYECGARGGDAGDGGGSVFVATSRTYYAPAGSTVDFRIRYANLDTAVVTSLLVEAHVQRIV